MLAEKLLNEADIENTLRYVIDARGNCEDEFLGCFPAIKSCATTTVQVHPICAVLKRITLRGIKNELDEETTTVDQVFGAFLFGLTKVLKRDVFSFASLVFRAFRECLNEFGYDAVKRYRKFVAKAEMPNIQIKLRREGEK